MSDEPDNLVLRYLRNLSARTDAMHADMRDMKHRLTSVERQVGQLGVNVQSQYASVMDRLDRVEDRLDRIERRLDLVEPIEQFRRPGRSAIRYHDRSQGIEGGREPASSCR